MDIQTKAQTHNVCCKVTTDGGHLGHQAWWFQTVMEGVSSATLITQAVLNDSDPKPLTLKVERVKINPEAKIENLGITGLTEEIATDTVMFQCLDLETIGALKMNRMSAKSLA